MKLKTDEDEDRVIVDNLRRMSNSLSRYIYNNNINMNFLSKVEVIKQYRQSVMNSGNVVFFFRSIKEKLSKFKVVTMAVIYGKNTKLLNNMSLDHLHDLISLVK